MGRVKFVSRFRIALLAIAIAVGALSASRRHWQPLTGGNATGADQGQDIAVGTGPCLRWARVIVGVGRINVPVRELRRRIYVG